MNNNLVRQHILSGVGLMLFLPGSIAKNIETVELSEHPVRNPFIKLLPPDCQLPIGELLAIESIGVIKHQIHTELTPIEFPDQFQLWFALKNQAWKTHKMGDEIVGEWLIDAIGDQTISLVYQGEMDKRCEDTPALRQYQLTL